jgi:2'-5' RNA ligase
MALDSTEGPRPEGTRPRMYALVIYIPDPLGTFLDDLRRELAPNCNPHAHVSVLPPRSLAVEWQVASEYVRPLAEGWESFDVELTEVQVFGGTNVIYLDVEGGASCLRGLHAALATEVLEYPEPFPYHPHVTLAQEFPAGDVPRLMELARRRWREFPGSRTFRAGRAVLVRSTDADYWQDLAEYSIGDLAVR